MPTERSRMELLQVLTEKLGPDAAAALMECVPPFPWTEIATKHDLTELEDRMGLRIDRLEATVDGRLDGMEGRLVGMEGRLVGMEGRLVGMEGRLTALVQEKLSAQNRGLLLVAAAAIIGSVVANILG